MMTGKPSQKPINSIIKFYPSLKNNLKNQPVMNTGNLSIFSYTKNG